MNSLRIAALLARPVSAALAKPHLAGRRSTPHEFLHRPALWVFAIAITLLVPSSAIAQKAYITNLSDGTVSVINTATNAVCTTATCVSTATYPIPIGTGTEPGPVAVSSDGTRVFVANESSDNVSVIDTAADAVIATVSLGSVNPTAIAVLPDNSYVYVVNENKTVSVFPFAGTTVTATITLPSPVFIPTGIAASPDSSTVYVSSLTGIDGVPRSQVFVISTESNTVTGTVSAPPLNGFDYARGIAFSPDGKKAYVVDQYGLRSIDTRTSTVVSSLILNGEGGGGEAVAVSPDGSTIYVPNNLTSTTLNGVVYVIDASSMTLTSTITVGIGPSGVAFSNDGTTVYVVNHNSNSVTPISASTGTALTPISVGTGPFAYGVFIKPPASTLIEGKELGPKSCHCDAASAPSTLTSHGNVSGGEPIDVASGNMSYQATDYTTAGQNAFAFTRFYNSRGKDSGISTFAGSLGVNWRSTFDRYLQISSTSQVIAERAGGQQLTFILSGSTWTPDTDVDVTLTQSGTTWTLTDSDDTVETYTTTTAGNEALLNSIKSRDGYTQTLTYNSSNQLTSVSDSYSRSFTLTYNTNGTLNTVTTPDSTTLTYGYTTVTGGIQLTSITYPTSPTTSQTYLYANSSLPFALTSITDENGTTFNSWTYDAYGRGLTSQQGSGANLTTLVYNTDGTRTVTNPLGVTDTYTFTTLQGVPKVTGISRAATSTTAAATESMSYDSNGYLASLTDWNGNQTTYTNNVHGQPTTLNEAVGSTVARTTTTVYDTTFVHLPDSIATPGVTTSFTYDSSGNLLTRTLTDTTTTSTPYSTSGQTRTWTYTYNSTGEVLTAKNPRTNTTTFTYASDGALTSITDALSHATSITTHTGGGRPLTVTDPNSVTTTLTYDPRQRLLSSSVSTTGGARTTTYTYDAAGNLTQTTLPDSSYLANTYDTAHRVTKVTDALGNYIAYTLDALGDRTQINTYNSSATLKRQHSATFDYLGRMLTDVAGAGQTTTYTYDANGNALTIKDGLSHTTTRTYDALNRMKTSTDPNSGVTTMAYNAHDRLTSVTDPNSNATTYVLDGFQGVIQQASPDSGTTVYHYDADGNMTSKTDAASNVTNQTFDTLDRVLTTTYPADSTLNVAYTYDQTTGHGFGIGRLTSLTDASGSLSKSYDERANLLTEARTIGTSTLTTTYTYDPSSRIASLTYPSGTLATYTRDSMGRVTNVAAKAPGASTAINLASGITYAPFGPETQVVGFNGAGPIYGLDLDYRITTTDEFSHTIYTYDNANNVTAITDWTYPYWNINFTYDVLNRLTNANAPYGYGNNGFTYDANGNLTGDGSGITISYFSGTNRLNTASWVDPTYGPTTYANSYTPTGNVSNIEIDSTYSTYTASYNAANKLASMTNVLSAFNASYDYAGQRTIVTPYSGGTNYFTYDQGGRMLEEAPGTQYTDYIYLNGRLIGLQTNTASGGTSTLYYVTTDRLGTVRMVSDSSLSIVWGEYLYPYGIEDFTGGSILQSLSFPGHYLDEPTQGFNYNLNRYYYARWGRYQEPDPIGLAGGLNPYVYANNNPYGFTDSSGTEIAGAVIGGLYGAFSAGYGASRVLNATPVDIAIAAVLGGVTGVVTGFVVPPTEILGAAVVGGLLGNATDAIGQAVAIYREGGSLSDFNLPENVGAGLGGALAGGEGAYLACKAIPRLGPWLGNALGQLPAQIAAAMGAPIGAQYNQPPAQPDDSIVVNGVRIRVSVGEAVRVPLSNH